MSSDGYLQEYQKAHDVNLYAGIGGRIRRWLDDKAKLDGQRDRHALFLPRVLDLFGLTLDKSITVLEIGAGSGWAISYSHPNVKYIAVDRGSYYKNELEARDVLFYESEVGKENLPIEDDSIDLVILNHLIEHIEQSDYLVQELLRVLRPNPCSAVYIRTPNIARVKWSFWNDYTHVKPFTMDALEHLMIVFGFKREFMMFSDSPRISLDILTAGRWRNLLFGKLLGGKEIEAGFCTGDRG